MNPEILPLGDQALLINFEQSIDPEIHQQVMNLTSTVEEASIHGIRYLLPAYCSLTLGYDPAIIKYTDLKHNIRELCQSSDAGQPKDCRKLIIPVCYEAPYNLDLEEISQFSGLDQKEIIKLHTETAFRVYMLGFLPGFPYLGILPKPLHLSRRANPRVRVPERSVGIAGLQTGIYPSQSPGGWNILGSTPLPVFNPKNENPFLFRVGDLVRFKSISVSEYQAIEEAIEQITFDWSELYDEDA